MRELTFEIEGAEAEQRLVEAAHKRGVTVGELLRQLVDEFLTQLDAAGRICEPTPKKDDKE